jgi:hypothetical protein
MHDPSTKGLLPSVRRTKSGDDGCRILFDNADKIFEHEVVNVGVVFACRVGFWTDLDKI